MKTNKGNIKKELQDLKAENLLKHFEQRQDIPKDYFENIAANVQKEIKVQKLNFKRIIIPIAIAAAFLILIAMPLLKPSNQKIDWNQFSKNDFEYYIKQNIEEFTEEEIASISALPENSIFINTEYSNKELEYYFLDMDIQDEELF